MEIFTPRIKLPTSLLLILVLIILTNCDQITSSKKEITKKKLEMVQFDFPTSVLSGTQAYHTSQIPVLPGTQPIRHPSQELPENYCYISTLNANGSQQAYTNRAFKISLPEKMQEKAQHIDHYHWITFKMASSNAKKRHGATVWKNRGIVRIAKCWIPNIDGIVPQLKKQLKTFGTDSWVSRHKPSEQQSTSNNSVAIRNVASEIEAPHCDRWWVQDICTYRKWYVDGDYAYTEFLGCKTVPLGCARWSGGGSGGGGGSNNDPDNDPDPCRANGTNATTTVASKIQGGPSGNGSLPRVPGCKYPKPDKPCKTSASQVEKTFPAAPESKVEKITNLINKYAKQFGIDNIYKLQQLLAQVDAETSFKDLVENGHSKRWYEVHYGNNPILGNLDSLSGYTYRGRGILQVTGKYLYNEFTKFYDNYYDSNLNFVKNPALLGSNLKISVISGLWVFFRKMNIYGIDIDKNTSVTRVSQAINGSDHKPPNGLIARKKAFIKVKNIVKECQ